MPIIPITTPARRTHGCRPWSRSRLLPATCVALAAWHALPSVLMAAELRVGTATVDITPDKPVALAGQMHTRIADTVESPVTATVLALEGRTAAGAPEQAVFVACDLVSIPDEVLAAVRERVAARVPDLPPRKIILSATHTHTAPVVKVGTYDINAAGVIQPADYVVLFADRVAAGIAAAWEARAAATAGWGLGHAVVAANRRSVYADGSAVMYGKTGRPDFRMIEGYEDHGLEALFFWTPAGDLLATAIEVPCPAQEVEGRRSVNADFWHEVRATLRGTHGERLDVLGWTGASGDQSPHLMTRSRAEERMRELRGLTRLEEIARRIVAGWEEAHAGAARDRHADVVLAHHVETLALPPRVVTQREADLAAEQARALAGKEGQEARARWHLRVVDRHERQQAGTAEPFPIELHVVRLGDVAICTNPFELYTDFGLAMKARSPALQTFVIQLAGAGTYLPSARAVAGGGYSAIAESNAVGPEAGQVLVDRTIAVLESLWQVP